MAGSPPQAPRNERYFVDVYRYVPALADMPDVRSLGSTTDTLGRTGVLEDQTRVGDRAAPNIDTLILDVGWTSTSLHEPALPGGTAGAAGTSSA
jgi:hypothetical protein